MTTVKHSPVDVARSLFNQRIRFYGLNVFGTMKRYADALQVSSQSLNNYVRDASPIKPGLEFISKLYDIGMNIHWMITGEGEMFADTEVGQKMKAVYDSRVRAFGHLPNAAEAETMAIKSQIEILQQELEKRERGV